MSSWIASVVLAAGTSSRMAGRNKLLSEIDGITLIDRAMRAALGSRSTRVVVVTGWQANHVEAALATLPASKPVTVVHNEHYGTGLASSLRCALSHLSDPVDAALVQLADMPWIAAAHLDRLIDAFNPVEPSIVVPVSGGRRGHPVLWPRRYFPAIGALSGDVGARELLVRYASEVHSVPFETDAILRDVDTPDELAQAQGQAPVVGAGSSHQEEGKLK